jgi:hypothetical protein
MSVILGLEIGAILTAAIIVVTNTAPNIHLTALSGIFFLIALFTFGLAVACIVQLCMRKQPRIPVLSAVAYRIAYGKTRPR